jgi:hypothetical protein
METALTGARNPSQQRQQQQQQVARDMARRLRTNTQPNKPTCTT